MFYVKEENKMWDTEKVVLVTNNGKASEKYTGIFEVIEEDSYEKVLLKVTSAGVQPEAKSDPCKICAALSISRRG